ncbi:tRNA (N(6)-L-threonylcarbamoyladenosine(37)-C(2))-methylthiotransferase [Candidatus Woesearchaeota archaeon]|nr:MAG: tRNA (N(6)-L-threonylcarbamoyladenosine(37)-C(2))-methylthiotransferase [Candidatus Woesearchaeota archaeon]
MPAMHTNNTHIQPNAKMVHRLQANSITRTGKKEERGSTQFLNNKQVRAKDMRVYVKSFGCSANFAEGEIIKGKFSEKGSIVDNADNADTILLNICTVKGDKTALEQVRKLRAKYPQKKLAIAGCITPSIAESIKKIDNATTLVNTHNILNIVDLVNTNTDALSKGKPIKLMQPRIRTTRSVGIIPISSGCLDACAFCSTRIVKGTLFSYPAETIEREVKACVEDGCKEIWITGQDTCCYGFDRKTNLAQLLKRLVEIPGNFKIRVGMGNPRHLPKYLEEFIEIMKHPKMFKFAHIPVQAGNDQVLKAMRRGHNVAQFKNIAKKLRCEIPEITLSTDIIVGYPTETEEQFQDTLSLCKQVQFDIINISRFSPRPGTLAASMEGQVHGNIKKKRSRELTALQMKIQKERNQKWIGWKGEIIVSKKVKGGVSGRNYAYKSVFIPSQLEPGDIVKAKITDAKEKFLKAELIEE